MNKINIANTSGDFSANMIPKWVFKKEKFPNNTLK